MTARRILLFFLCFLIVLVLRSIYGATMFAGEDAFQVYLIGLKWYTTQLFPYWGPDVVYTQSQIPGALQGLLVGGPFFLKAAPESPYLLLNLLSLTALCLLSWYLSRRIQTVPKWFVWAWLLTAPWVLSYSTHIENPSYLLPVSVLFFVCIWELFPMYEQKIMAARWAFFGLGFSLFWVMQLHLSWVLMLPYIGLAFGFQLGYGRAFWRAMVYFLMGAVIPAGMLVPTFLEFGLASSGGTEQNIGLNLGNLTEIPNIAAKMVSFACGEVVRFIGANHPERFDFLKSHVWAAPATVFFALIGLAQFCLLALSFFQKRAQTEWNRVRAFMLGSIALVCFSYLFTHQPPKAHAFYLMVPVAMWYSFYAYGHLFAKRWFRILAVVFLISGIIFQVAVAQKNAQRYGLWLKRAQIESAITKKDYTLLGVRRESILEMARWGNVWERTATGMFHTGYEYPNPAYKPQNISNSAHRNGQYSCKMDSIFPFGGGFKEKIDFKTISKCQCTAFLKGDFGGTVVAVFEVKSKGQNILWKSLPINREQYTPTNWEKVEFNIEIPPAAQAGDEAMFYFWLNTKAGGTLFADDVAVSFK